MKIIDLLNKIANGEEVPKKIKYRNKIFDYEDADYFNIDMDYLFDRYSIPVILNDEVEIIEEENKIPEKLKDRIKDNCIEAPDNFILMDKINEILDYLKNKGDE